MPQQKSLSEQLPLDAKTPLYPWLKRLLAILEPRFDTLEGRNDDLDTAIELVREVALFRINEVLLPSVIRIQALTSLGFLVANSSVSAALALGPKIFIIDEGTERDLFTPSPFVTIEARGDKNTYAIARVDLYDNETGRLDVTIQGVFGSTAARSDWVIASSAGVGVATRQNASDAVDAMLNARAARDAAISARDSTIASAATATTKAGEAAASAASALASKNAAEAAAGNVLNPVLFTPQNLDGGKQKQAKSNIGAVGISFAYLASDVTLQPTDAGNMFLCSGQITVTVPAVSSMKSGSSIMLSCWNRNDVAANGNYTTIQVVGGGNISWHGGGGPSMPLYWTQSVWLFCTGTEWLAFFKDAPVKGTPSAFTDMPFTGIQRNRLRRQLGVAIGRRYYQLANTPGGVVNITSADCGAMVYLEGDITGVKFPLVTTTGFGDGDYVDLYARGTVTVTVQAGDPYSFGWGQDNSNTFTMQPGDRCRVQIGQDAWDVMYYSTRRDKALMADRAQSFSATEINRLLANIGLANGGLVPPGAIMIMGLNVAPTGWMKCQGQVLNRADYPALWAAAQAGGQVTDDGTWQSYIGYFSSGNGSTTFRIPDLRGVFVRGFNENSGRDPNGNALGLHIGDTFASHGHGMANGGSVITSGSGANVGSGPYLGISSIAGNGGNETRGRQVQMNYFIKT